MDEFKKLIENNRQEFDIYDTNYDELWNGVEVNIEKPRSQIWILKVAAAILLLVSFAGIVYQTQFVNDSVPLELAEAEADYLPLIEEKITLVKASYPQMDSVLWGDLNQIDLALRDLKADLKDDADNEEVIYAMIENYSIKLKILERILTEVNKEENVQTITI